MKYTANGPSSTEEYELMASQDEALTRPATSISDVSALHAELEKMKAERDSLLDRAARQQAELENIRKRTAREQQEFKDFALADELASLLPILDSFEQALRAPAQNLEEFRSGVELIRKQWLDAMSKLGLRLIPASGEPFDPRLHEAIEIVDTAVAEDNHVVEELQAGYKLGERLLRPARVRVARNPRT